MGKIVGDTACPSCRENGHDKTGNHLIMFEDGGAYCNRCHYTCNWKEQELTPIERKVMTEEEWQEHLSDFNDCKSGAIPARKIYKSTAEYYGVKLGVHPSDKTKIGSYLFPQYNREDNIVSIKVRLADKKTFFNIGIAKQINAFFGQHLIPKNKDINKLYIAEGELDTLSVFQAIKDSWKGKPSLQGANPYVIGVPNGAGSLAKLMSENKDMLDKCKEIVLVLDNDEEGNKAAEKAFLLMPNKVRVVKLPLKDPNDMLMAGKSDELARLSLFGSTVLKMDGLDDIGDIIDEVLEEEEAGISYPWPTMTKATFGAKTQKIIGFVAAPGIGKSEVKYEISSYFALKHYVPVLVFDLEYNRKETAKRLAGKALGKVLHRPDRIVSIDEIKEGMQKLSGKVKLYKHRGNKGWNEVKEYIRHAAIVDGVKFVFIDPITALTSHLSSSEANDELNKIFSEMSSLTHELDITIFYFAHPNPPKTGLPHERGGKIYESQITGSRAAVKWSHEIWGIERNKDPEAPEYERNTMYLVKLKCRDYGISVKFPIYYNSETGQLIERFT